RFGPVDAEPGVFVEPDCRRVVGADTQFKLDDMMAGMVNCRLDQRQARAGATQGGADIDGDDVSRVPSLETLAAGKGHHPGKCALGIEGAEYRQPLQGVAEVGVGLVCRLLMGGPERFRRRLEGLQSQRPIGADILWPEPADRIGHASSSMLSTVTLPLV